ncbi:hypothetical protein EMIHUDRAFT_248625 [Emiliania huxleyi CCMP1516]|uniref:Uncharacterized protein n=2 Tax=Emiliania huxleyi TaxID=2903 RepID=A0A0D3IF49_EMIH1|nr:hypothetical protein EMIHUDRAFT_248625 [Emiliania huxleyi CCMP1516]EOD09884.1 hypothetical protein EMIHUDRAFT_248625 [Emiliania huxleyi CCMP1516]|eukprot:XP_005762313.1 hypothetical protein EMIHUDRAFT_248625 [Emiliania huxleyi CCMP1516]
MCNTWRLTPLIYVSLAVTLANLAACAAARPGGELAVHLLPDNVEGDGLWIVGSAWPIAAQTPAEAFQLPAGIHKWQAKSGCVFDDAPEGGPFTLLIDNFGACDDSSLYEHLRDKLGQTQAGSQSLSPPVDGWGVVLPSDSSDAHALHLANFETGDLPPDFPGTVISVSKTLGDKLKAKLNVTRVALDTPVHASTVQGHTTTFLYRHAGARAETDLPRPPDERSHACNVTLVSQHSHAPCIAGKGYGCVDATNVWVRNCRGFFQCDGGKLPSLIFACGFPPGKPTYRCRCDGRQEEAARVLVLGNSHTNQLIQSMLCRFHAEVQHVALHNDNIPGTIRRLLGVHTLAEFSVIVFHHLNGDWWAQKWAGYDHQCGSTIARRLGGPPSALTFAAQLQASSFRGTLLVDTAGLSDQYHVASADILCAAGEHFSRLAHIKTQCWDFLRRYMVDHRTKWACALDDVYHQCIPGPIDAVTDIWLAILWRVKTEAQAWRPRALMLRLDAVYASRSAAAPDGFEECINFWYRECGLPAELRSQLHSLRIWANAARHYDAARWRRDWPRSEGERSRLVAAMTEAIGAFEG